MRVHTSHPILRTSKFWTAPEAFSVSAKTVIWCWFLGHLLHVAWWTHRYSQSGRFALLGKPSPGPVEPEPPKRARGRLRRFLHSQFVSANLFDLSDFLARLCLLEWFQSCLGHCDQYLICHFCLKIGWIDASGVFCSLDPSCSCKSVEWELGRKFWGHPFSKFSLFKQIFDLRGWHES